MSKPVKKSSKIPPKKEESFDSDNEDIDNEDEEEEEDNLEEPDEYIEEDGAEDFIDEVAEEIDEEANAEEEEEDDEDEGEAEEAEEIDGDENEKEDCEENDDKCDDRDNVIDVGAEEYDIELTSVRVPDEERITNPFLTKYEIARIIGVRVQQLIKSAPALVSNITGKPPIQIALDELLSRRIPFKIKRQMPYPKHEIWRMSELFVKLSQDDIDDLIACINV
jgi:DNA-directed RNA polymerase subunit K/omega